MTHSHIDTLAEQLTKLTGTKFEVLRGRPPLINPTSSKKAPMRYGLKVTRKFTEEDTFDHSFFHSRPVNYNQMSMYLASLLDMIHMGFLPITKEPTP